MSKIYDKYSELKSIDPEKMYLFKCGKFYIFIDDDCETINNYVVLKKVNFCKDVLKCGFPSNVLDDYMRVFKNHDLDIEIIEEVKEEKRSSIKEILLDIDIDNMKPIDALIKLKELKEYAINEKRS